MIDFRCSCGVEYLVPDNFAGKSAQCYRCNVVVLVSSSIPLSQPTEAKIPAPPLIAAPDPSTLAAGVPPPEIDRSVKSPVDGVPCPSCGFVQPKTNHECVKCHILFAKWRQAASKAAMSPSSPEASSSKGLLRTAIIFVSIGLLVFLGWQFIESKKGLPVPDGAYKNEKYNFAIVYPAAFTMTSSDDVSLTKLGHLSASDQLKKFFQTGDKFKGFIFNLNVGVPVGERASPHFDVLAYDAPMPLISDLESNRDKYVQAMMQGLNGEFSDFVTQSAELVKIDNLDALKITGTGNQVSVQSKTTSSGFWQITTPVYITIPLKLTRIFVPGSENGYVITYMTHPDDWSTYEKSFAEIVDSFRMTKRISFVQFLQIYKSWLGWFVIGIFVGFFRWIFSS